MVRIGRKKVYLFIFWEKFGEEIAYINQRKAKNYDKNKVLRAKKLEHLLIHLDDRYVAL